MGAFEVPGFRFAGINCGIKKSDARDLAVIVADRPVACAGVFTTNLVVAAPVVQSRAKLPGLCRAVVVNSGNANACTGARGDRDCAATAAAAAEALGCSPDQIQVASTGVIGQWLPMDALLGGLPAALDDALPGGVDTFAQGIMTTDTRMKLRTAAGRWRVAGASKGAGMIHPDMATMLGFVVTDAPVAPDELDALWRRVCGRTFNAITVDGDTSTNDTALILASGEGPPLTGADLAELEALVEGVARALALDIVRDAEGGTKTVAIQVSGARSFEAAQAVANTVALSPLVKTALHGEDPNWGRIIAAAGRSGVVFDPSALRLWIGETLLYARGQWQGAAAEAAVHATMQTAEYALRLDLGGGDVAHTVFTCDFGAGYVRINADYRS
jgi:glutamate N-acetyltransferase / amino-acid N-acetyltransferase